MLNPHRSRPVWSFSSQSKTKVQPRDPTTPGDGVERAIVYVISKRKEFTSKESPRGLFTEKTKTPAEMNSIPFPPLGQPEKG